MSSLDAHAWTRVSQHLDAVLDLDASGRGDYLARLQTEQPQDAATLNAILASRTRPGYEDFLGATPTPVAELADASRFAGSRLGPYLIEAEIGRGGMGTVWRARRADGQYEGHVAIKVLSAALVGKPAEHRLRREGSVLAQLRHPHIAQLFDAGVASSGQAYLVLEHIEGQRIDEYCDTKQLGIRERLGLLLDVMAAVSHAHRQLIVHRDIKPTNILVTADGRARLLDFGIATLLRAEEGEQSSRTVDAATALTPDYAAPEQFLGQPVTTATDVYALGMVLYLLVTGRHPRAHAGNSTIQRIRAAVEEDVPPPNTGTDLDNVLGMALRREPLERYASVDAFADDLRRYLADEPVKARPDTLTYRASKFMRRHRGGVVTATLTVLGLIGLSLFAWLQMNAARVQRDEALTQKRRAEAEASFVTLMLDSMGESDKPITMSDLLDRGLELLDRSYQHDPEFRVHTLINMSGRYMDAGLTDREAATLQKAEIIALQTGDPELIAEVKCDSVETRLSEGHLDQAARMLEEGRTALARVTTPSTPLQADCLHAQGSLADAQGRLDEAQTLVARAVAQLEAAGPERIQGVQYSGLLSHLAVLYMRQGNDAAALDTSTKELRTLERLGRLGTLHVLAVRNNIARTLDNMGEVHAGLDELRKTVAEDQVNDSLALHPVFSQTYGLLLSRAGNHELALKWFDRAVRDAAAGVGGAGAELTARVRLAREHAFSGCAADAARDLAAIDSRIAGHEEEFAGAVQALPIARAEYLLAKGDATAAQASLDSLPASTARSDNPATRGTRMRVLEIAVPIALAQRRLRDAESLTDEMIQLARARARNASVSVDVGQAYLAKALVLVAEGRAAEARTAAREAQQVLVPSLGNTHAWTRAAALLSSGEKADVSILRPQRCSGRPVN